MSCSTRIHQTLKLASRGNVFLKNHLRQSAFFLTILVLFLSVPFIPSASSQPVAKDAPKDFRLVSPLNGHMSEGEPLFVVIRSDARPVDYVILVDGMDVTGSSEVSGTGFIYRSEAGLEPGEHSVEVSGIGPNGEEVSRSWKIQVNRAAEAQELPYSVSASGGLSLNYGRGFLDKASGKSLNQVTANLGLALSAEGPGFDLAWDGINVQYDNSRDTDNLTVASGFYLALSGGYHLVEYGDISVNETPLVAPGFARRGIQLKLFGKETEMHIFDVQSAPATGFESGLDNDFSEQVYGASIRRSLLPNNRLNATLAYIAGGDAAIDGVNVTTTEAARKGEVVGALLTHTMSKARLNLEAAMSRVDQNTADTDPAVDGFAWNANLSGRISSLSAGAGYVYSDPNFMSVANPEYSSDRAGYNAFVSGSSGYSNASFTVSRLRDNVENDRTRPVVYSTSGTLAWGLSVPGWPALSLSLSRSQQDSGSEPDASSAVNNVNDAVTASLQYTGDAWSAGGSSSWGYLNDKVNGNDSATRAYSVTGAYNPGRFVSASADGSLTESEAAGVTNRDWLFAATIGMPLYRPYANLNMQASYAINTASDGSQDSRTLNGTMRIAVNIHEFIKKWVNTGGESLAVSFNYSDLDDDVDPSASSENYSGFLTLSFYQPIRGKYAF